MNDAQSFEAAAGARRPHHAVAVRLVLAAAFIVLYTACSACEKDRKAVTPELDSGEKGVVRLTMGGVDVVLEVADTDQKRGRGLMQRKRMDWNRGMIFIYDTPKIMSFYMKDTLIPLSIAFLKEDGTITNIEKMKPMVESPSHLSRGLCRFAIEMNQGWFEQHGVKAGDRIELTQEILDYPVE